MLNYVSSSPEAWRRHALLAISILFVVAGIAMGFGSRAADLEFGRGVCLKVGIVLFMIWLALPQLQRLNPWLFVPVASLALAAIVRPQLLLILPKIAVPLAPILFLLWLFWVPKKNRST